MAYIVMAYIVMPFIVMAFIVMAYIAIAYIVMVYIVVIYRSNFTGMFIRKTAKTRSELFPVDSCDTCVEKLRMSEFRSI